MVNDPCIFPVFPLPFDGLVYGPGRGIGAAAWLGVED